MCGNVHKRAETCTNEQLPPYVSLTLPEKPKHMELKHIVRRAVRRWAEKIASKRAQRQARLALPNVSKLCNAFLKTLTGGWLAALCFACSPQMPDAYTESQDAPDIYPD